MAHRDSTGLVLCPLIISAPFGNYIQPSGTTPTLGTFTALRRGGVLQRVWRVARTVRYYPGTRAWVNRIGLRNPGIDWLCQRAASGAVDVADKLVSVHGFSADEWYRLLDRIAELQPMAVELNVSCPNVGHISWPLDLFSRAVATGVPVVVKVPPIEYSLMVEQAHEAGIRHFHCCNTLPVPGGGMSGTPLLPLSLACIRDLRARSFGQELVLIGGGGIYQPTDIDAYARAGADHVAIATKLFHPKYLISHRPILPLLHQARSALPARRPS